MRKFGHTVDLTEKQRLDRNLIGLPSADALTPVFVQSVSLLGHAQEDPGVHHYYSLICIIFTRYTSVCDYHLVDSTSGTHILFLHNCTAEMAWPDLN